MKLKIGMLLLMCFGVVVVSAQEKVNQVDKNGKKTGIWIKYYENNKIRYQGQFEADKEVGVFKYYSAVSSEHPIIIKTFSKETGIAKVEFFTVEGKLESKGEMDGAKRIGKWLYYLSDGETLVSEENYTNGLLNGEAKTYYRNGKITEILHFKNGLLNGNIKRYSDEGIVLDDLNYTNGKLQGLAKYYDTFGNLKSTGNYENNEKVGSWKYFENGEAINPKKMKQ